MLWMPATPNNSSIDQLNTVRSNPDKKAFALCRSASSMNTGSQNKITHSIIQVYSIFL